MTLRIYTPKGTYEAFDFLWSIFKRFYLAALYPAICERLSIAPAASLPAVISMTSELQG
jgi:hypothetical protein